MVDDDTEPPVPVIRVDNPETEFKDHQVIPIRLGPQTDDVTPTERRLDLPSRDEIELRTHQPGIDVLIEPEPVAPETLEHDWGEASKRNYPIPWGWFVLIALLISAAVIWSWTRVHTADARAERLESQTKSILVDEAKEQQEATQLIDRIDKIMRDYFSATEVDTLVRMVRQPERVAPLMHRHYSNKPVFEGSLRAIKSLNPLTLAKQGNFWMAGVSLSDGNTKNLVIEIDPAGEPKIDWETLVCYQPMAWDDYVARRPAGTPMDFRVYAEPDSLYSHEFASSERWTCFRLTTLNSDECLFGYVPANGELEKSLRDLLEKNRTRKISVILRLNIPDGVQSHRGVIIEKLVNPLWLFVSPADSGM